MSQSIYGAHFLPCGKYARDINTSCSTECPHFSNEEIEQCYAEHKRKLIEAMKKFFGRKIKEEEWYIYRDVYFTYMLKENGGVNSENNTETEWKTSVS
jgi:hypothetical protein